MALDPRRLRKDVATRKAARPADDTGPGARRRTGAMAVVREHLADIETLRAEGARWSDIAAAMAAQGVTQGDGAPLTERRLTALIASVRKQEANWSSAREKRAARPDLSNRTAAASEASAPPSTLTLSPELVTSTQVMSEVTSRDIEEALRRDNFDRVQALLKPELYLTKKDTKR